MNALKLYIVALFQAAIAPFDHLLGVQKKTYVSKIDVRAPAVALWDVLTARDLKFDGWMPIHVVSEPDPRDKNKLVGQVTIAEHCFRIAMRILQKKHLEKLVIQVLEDETDDEILPGRNYVVSKQLIENGEKTRLISVHHLDSMTLMQRMLMPFNVVSSDLRLAREAERRAQAIVHSHEGLTRHSETDSSAVQNAIVTGIITFASFLAFFPWTSALILLLLILVHEVGHVIAMRQMGHSVRGIYFVPFMGGVAISNDSYANEGERGYIALMGPGFSVITTAALAFFAYHHPDVPLLRHAAFLSAVLNVFNLLPVLPLDGGHVLGSLLSRGQSHLRAKIQQFILVCAVGVCAFNKLWIAATLAFVTLASISATNDDNYETALPAVSTREQLWLLIAYIATIAFYIGVIFTI